MNPFLTRFHNEPALIAGDGAAWLESCVTQGLKVIDAMTSKASASTNIVAALDDFWFRPDDWRSAYRPYSVRDGVLRVPVRGLLMNKFPWAIDGWMTGYDYIREAVKRGLADPEVKGIALMIDSNGGMVSGNLDLADYIYESRGKKPIKAYADDSAYSAAYAIASAASSIMVSRSGGVGSIGVVTTHVDISEMMKNDGVKVTFVYAGKHKVDGNPYEALPQDVRDRIQARVEAIYTEFAGMVARNRGLDEKAIRATEALTYTAPEALEIGLVDAIGRPDDDEITAFGATFSQEEEDDMAENMAQITSADLETAKATAFAEGATKGAADERARITGILGSEEAKSRPAVAMTMVKLGISAEQAVVELAALPEESKPAADAPTNGAGAPAGMLDASMGGNGVDDTAGQEPDDKTKFDEALLMAACLPGFKQKQSQ